MKIDISKAPDADIFRNRKTYLIWFLFSLSVCLAAIAMGAYVIYVDSVKYPKLEDWAVWTLAIASLFVSWFGNRLQAYKRLLPPQEEKLAKWRRDYSLIDRYCSEVEKIDRPLIRAEYDACRDYAEEQSEGAE